MSNFMANQRKQRPQGLSPFFDLRGLKIGKSRNSEPLKVHEKETSHVRQPKPKPHNVGLQVSCFVWIPKFRKKTIYGDLRKYLGDILRELATQKECKVVEGHLMPDHVHILLCIPPKYSVSQVVGFIKGKSAIQIARNFQGRKKNFVGQNFWARGYYVSTIGKDEEIVRAYIQNQEKEDQRLDQLRLFE